MPTKHSYRRGDVVLVGFPNSDLVTYKTRPALIVQATIERLKINMDRVVNARAYWIKAGGHPPKLNSE